MLDIISLGLPNCTGRKDPYIPVRVSAPSAPWLPGTLKLSWQGLVVNKIIRVSAIVIISLIELTQIISPNQVLVQGFAQFNSPFRFPFLFFLFLKSCSLSI